MDQDLPDIYKEYMSEFGTSIGIDFGIGNKKYLGRGLAAPTLEAFIKFYKDLIDSNADTFFIDPDEHNPRARHVYSKAGFKLIGEYEVRVGPFKGHINSLMMKKSFLETPE